MVDTSYVTVNVNENDLISSVNKSCCDKFRHCLSIIRTGLYIGIMYIPCVILCKFDLDHCIIPCFREGNCCNQDNWCGCGPVFPS